MNEITTSAKVKQTLGPTKKKKAKTHVRDRSKPKRQCTRPNSQLSHQLVSILACVTDPGHDMNTTCISACRDAVGHRNNRIESNPVEPVSPSDPSPIPASSGSARSGGHAATTSRPPLASHRSPSSPRSPRILPNLASLSIPPPPPSLPSSPHARPSLTIRVESNDRR